MMIIDSQIHAYEANTPARPWATQPHGWPPSATGDEMVAAMDAVEPFRLTDRLSESERAMLMGGACARAYGWSPKKA